MARVLMAWNRPHHLSDDEAESWTRYEVRRLAEVDGVASVNLTRVTPSSYGGAPWDWVCELELSADTDADACLRDPACSGWLHDLRLLGMRPTIAILGETAPLH